jgi:hypothetical protein
MLARIQSTHTRPRLCLLKTMPNDYDDREAKTNPDNLRPSEAPEHRDAIAPSPAIPTLTPATADSIFTDAVNKIVDAANVIKSGKAEAEAIERQRRADHDALLAAIQKADDNNQRSYKLLHNELLHLKDSDRTQNARLAEGDERFAAIEKSIANLKDELIALVTRATLDAAERIEALENELTALRNADRSPQAPAAPIPSAV